MRPADAITAAGRRRLVVVLLVAATVALGAGAVTVEETTGLADFRTESAEAEALEYVNENFTARGGDATPVQVIVEDENVLERESLLSILEFEAELREHEEINETFAADDRFVSVANVVATTTIERERAETLETRATELEATEAELSAALDRVHAEEREASAAFDAVQGKAPIELADHHRVAFEAAAAELRAADTDAEIAAAYRAGTRGVLAEEYDALESDRRELENGLDPTLEEQTGALESASDDEVEEIVASVLDDADGRNELFTLLPSGYEPGETEAAATVVVLFQDAHGERVTPNNAPEEIVETQTAIAEIADGYGYDVFGYGIMIQELDAAAGDSVSVVGPLTLTFVIGVLLIAYRDPLDVALGLFGIVLVLV